MSATAKFLLCSLVVATIYGSLFSLKYPLVDVFNTKLPLLFVVLGLATCFALRTIWEKFARKSPPKPDPASHVAKQQSRE